MSDPIKKRLRVNKLKPGMILAEEAVAPNGQLLIPSGTVITENHLFRMNLYQINSAVISIDEAIASTSLDGDSDMVLNNSVLIPDQLSKNDIRLYKTENYLRFSQTFSHVDHLVREHFDNILNGMPVDEDKLLAATKSLMNTVKQKSDLFNYMSHIKADDHHTYVHSINVSILCNIFGHWIKLDDDEIKDLTMAALIHDIGKTKIPSALLNKPDKLTKEEFDEVRQHAQLGYDIIRDTDLNDRIKQAVLLHHERNDGSGYPFGFNREQIPDFAKIIAITDIYDAMTSSRAYHKKFSPFNVIQLFEQESYGYLDTKYLFIFLENIAHYYLGEEVRLSDGTTGKIVFIHNQSPSRPIIQSGDTMIDLITTNQLYIEEIL